jgi:hypothetical protein
MVKVEKNSRGYIEHNPVIIDFGLFGIFMEGERS